MKPNSVPTVARRNLLRVVAASAATSIMSLSAVAIPPTDLKAPSDEQVQQICTAHPANCNCPGCRAFFDACDPGCPIAPDAYSIESADEYAGSAAETAGDAAAQPPSISGPVTAVPAGLGAVAAASSPAPSMIGDFFGMGYRYAALSPVNGATVAVAGGDRITKFADNNSPLPTDRVFFNYHHFDNSVVDVNGIWQDTNRFTFGIERTFLDGIGSVEFRVPFTGSVDATQMIDAAGTRGAEFGNLSMNVKVLALDRGGLAVAGGLGIVFPTADDNVILNSDGASAVTFANEAFHLQPYLGVYHRPNNRLFQQFVSQVSFDVSGNVVAVSDPSVFGSTGVDRVFDQSLLFLDYSVGYWVYRSGCCSDILTGVAPMLELHYTSTLDPLDLPAFDVNMFEEDFRRDALNLTAGLFFELGQFTAVKAAGVAPLREGTDRLFDAEFGLQLIHRY